MAAEESPEAPAPLQPHNRGFPDPALSLSQSLALFGQKGCSRLRSSLARSAKCLIGSGGACDTGRCHQGQSGA